MSTSLTTIAEIQTEFQVRQGSATTVANYTDSIIRNWIDEAHKFAASRYKWPMTEGRSSTSFASLVTDEDGFTYGVYPEGWKLRTIRHLEAGGEVYDKKNFIFFRKYFKENTGADDQFWTDYNNRYYINGGSGTVAVWGQFTPNLDLTDTAAKTIFSDIDEDGNQAIVELVQSFAMTKEKKEDEAKLHLEKALGFLDAVWKRFTDEGFAYQTPDNEGMFKRIDVVNGGLRDDLFKRDQFT